MENHRLLLYFTLFFLIYMLWAQWQIDYSPKPAQIATDNPAASSGEAAPTPAAVTLPGGVADSPAAEGESKSVQVITDVIEVEIDTRGGDVRRVKLRDYAANADQPEEKLELLTELPDYYFVAQSGLVSAAPESAPTHNAIYSVEQDSYRLAEGEEVIEVVLHWRNNAGTQVSKRFRFHRNSYDIDVEYNIVAGAQDWVGSEYMQLVRTPPPAGNESKFIYTYTGGVVFNQEIKYQRVAFDDIADEALSTLLGAEQCKNQDSLKQGCELKSGWLAMIQHHFLAAWLPQTGLDYLYYSRKTRQDNRYILGARSTAKIIKAGETGEFQSQLVVGPKLQYQLEATAPGLELTVDYGIFTLFAKPLFWLLDVYHGWFGNWGWAIIFLTITVKGVFYKLSEMSYKSMAKMRKVAPRIQAMKERFGDDRQAMSKAMMDMYKREKINPMGGCLPIMVQIPVFISLYWVLLESVEMRHAPFILWLTNLTDKDPYFVLPVIMGISMYVQQKLNPAPVDPIQQKVFQIMPFAFTIMFAFFPSGLVLYWVVNNLLSIAQQYVITRRIDNAA